MLDEIVWRAYGKQSGFVEKILDHRANYRIARYPEILPAGVTVALPDLVVQKAVKRLWDD